LLVVCAVVGVQLDLHFSTSEHRQQEVAHWAARSHPPFDKRLGSLVSVEQATA
jgi:hypothetical protein